MKKKKKDYQKPKISSEKVFEETALQCTVNGIPGNLNKPWQGCGCVRKASGGIAIRS